MDSHFLQQLRAQGATLHVRWETLLRMEPVSGPLANPDALVRLIPNTLAQILAQLAQPAAGELSLASANGKRLPACECGHNPFLAYFVACERAFVEAVVLLQAAQPSAARRESDLAEVILTIRRIGCDEIDTFCGVCTHRGKDEKCRHRHRGACQAQACPGR